MDVSDLVRRRVRAFCAVASQAAASTSASRKSSGRFDNPTSSASRSRTRRRSWHLSPGRFAHLFKEQLGLPFRRYMLWRKLTRAMLAIGRESNIASAAHASDFADAAHLTRTFHQMFGIPPSVMMRGEFFEIAPPLAAAG